MSLMTSIFGRNNWIVISLVQADTICVNTCRNLGNVSGLINGLCSPTKPEYKRGI